MVWVRIVLRSGEVSPHRAESEERRRGAATGTSTAAHWLDPVTWAIPGPSLVGMLAAMAERRAGGE